MRTIDVLLTGLLIVFATILVASPALADTIVYSEGFESGNGGYTHGNLAGVSAPGQWA